MTSDAEAPYFGAVALACGAFTLTFLFMGLALAVYPGWAAIGVWMLKADSPSWIQAWGAIATVLATMFVLFCSVWLDARRRVKQESERAAEEKIRNVLELNRLLFAATHVRIVLSRMNMESLTRSATKRKQWRTLETRVQGIRAYCEALPVWSQPNPELFKFWSQLLEVLICIDAAVQGREKKESENQFGKAIHICTVIESLYKTPSQEFAAFYYRTKLNAQMS